MKSFESIESLRCLMIKTAEQRGSLTHPDVLEISRRLDILINEEQRERFNKGRSRVLVRPRWSLFYRHYKSQVSRLFRSYDEI